MNVPRPDVVRKELSNMGAVYVTVFVVLVAALIYAVMPEDRPPPAEDPAIGVGPPRR